jgi:hypothetical protein
MARQRRGGGFRPPELRGTLGTLLRTTLAQAGTLRDALERGAREGRSRLDSALSNRRRTDALAELGDIVLDLIRRGEIDVGELPEVRDIVAHLDEIDAGLDHDAEHDEPVASATPPPVRDRFDARRSSPSSRSPRAGARDDDGTVNSRTWTRPSPAKPQSRVWRPPVDASAADADADADNADDADDAERDTARSRATHRHDRPDDEITARERPAPSRTSGRSPKDTGNEATPGRPASRSGTEDLRAAMSRKDPSRKGGIHFDEDDDLAQYMHPDDVPPKTPPDGDA